MSNKYGHEGMKGLSGKDIMRRINDGEFVRVQPGELQKVKHEITDNCEELIETGARIRPLLVEGQQVGWVRGIHPVERRMLKRWIKEPNDFVFNVLKLATSFTDEEINAFSGLEIRNLAEVVKRMSEYDMALFPYMSAFVCTQISENLWFGKGEKLTSYENRIIEMPDGKKLKIMAPADHARMWASLCVYREQAKRRLEENWNSLFIVRPWAGKSADPVAQDLRGIARQLETDSLDPWEKVVRVQPKVDVNDGWAHAGDSLEDLQRELKGMLEGDKHEHLMEVWAKQMKDEADGQKHQLEELRKKRGTDTPGVVEERWGEVLTDAQVRERQAAMKRGQPTKNRGDYELDPTERHNEKIQKYR
jgi:hypothetical protein